MESKKHLAGIMLTDKICAIIVTYNPQLEILKYLIETLYKQVSAIVIVDNSREIFELKSWIEESISAVIQIEVIHTGINLGLGKAHNIGIQYARDKGFNYIVQFDQDSLPEPDMIEQLSKAYQDQVASGYKVAAVGANWVDHKANSAAIFIQHQGCGAVKRFCPAGKKDIVISSDYLITSGCLIPIKVLNDVGNLDESLFIDFVDTEWCLRAKSKGYTCFGVCSAILHHELGDKTVKFLGRNFHYHSPLRHYYFFRNIIALYKKPYITTGWKLNTGLRVLIRFFLYPLIFTPRRQHLKMILLGLWHGLRGVSGPYQGSLHE